MGLFFNFETQKILRQVQLLAKSRKIKLYIVGGALRDLVLKKGKSNPDIDFTLKKGALKFARVLANKIHAGFVVLDKEHGVSRVVKRIDNKIYTLDFTDFRGLDLKSDLLRRDFTINTLALELDRAFDKNIAPALIDLYGAQTDLKNKIIKAAYAKSFDDDPLRILRAFSFAALFGFEIDRPTLKNASLKRKKIIKVSFERIRDELFKVLETNVSFEYFSQLDKLKILEIIMPEIKPMRGIGQGPYHHLDVWQHTLETLKQFELLEKKISDNADIQNYLNEMISYGRRRYSLLKFGALLHDVGKPKALRREGKKIIFHGHERLGLDVAQGIVKRLKLSNDEWSALRKIILWHLRPGYMADSGKELTPRAIFRYFRDANKEAVGILLLSIADQRATLGTYTTRASRINHEKVCFGLIKKHFHKSKEASPKRLINGNDVMRKFKLEPSPLVGKILAEIEELQAIGKIKTKEDALKAAGKFIKNNG